MVLFDTSIFPNSRRMSVLVDDSFNPLMAFFIQMSSSRAVDIRDASRMVGMVGVCILTIVEWL